MTEPQPQHSWRFRQALLLPALAIAVLTAYFFLSNLPGRYDKDWVHLWTGGKMVVTGHGSDLYNPQLHHEILLETYAGEVPEEVWPLRNQRLGVFFYPPPAAFYYAAIAWLPRGVGCGVNACLCVVFAAWNAWLLRDLTGGKVSWAAGTLVILAFPPFFANYALGQNAMLSMTVVVTAWWLAERDRELLAGMLIGLFVCKPNWLAAVGWIPLVHGRWRLLAGIAAGGAATILATVAVIGTEPFIAYVDLFRQVAAMHELPGYVLRLKCSSLGMFRKWFGVGHTADVLGWGCAGLVGLITVWLVRGRWKPGTVEGRTAMACCLMAALWVNPHLNDYDLMLMAAGAAVMVADFGSLARRSKCIAVAVLLFCYAADPWDHSWSLANVLPLPSFALLAMWAWFAVRTSRIARTAA